MTSPLISIAGKTIFRLLALLVLLVDPVAVADRPLAMRVREEHASRRKSIDVRRVGL